MMRTLVALVLLAALPAVAQQTEPSQVDAILFAARERMSDQDDAWFHDGAFLRVIQNEEILVGIYPSDEESWSNLAWMYQNVDRLDLQWATTRQFARANPTYRDAVYYEAEFCYSRKLYAKVPALLEPAIARSLTPSDNVFRFLAHSYEKMGYYEDALRVWDAFLKVKPNDGQGKVNRAKVAAKIKQ